MKNEKKGRKRERKQTPRERHTRPCRVFNYLLSWLLLTATSAALQMALWSRLVSFSKRKSQVEEIEDEHAMNQQPASPAAAAPQMNPKAAQDIPQTLYVVPEVSSTDSKGSSLLPAASAAGGPYTNNHEREPTCAVCLRKIQAKNPVKELCCAHVFHALCIDQWLHQEIHCPICKTQVLFPQAPAVSLHAERGFDHQQQQLPTLAHSDQHHTPDDHVPFAVPLDGTDARSYGICRDCQQTFYRDPKKVRPDTSAWYRCPNCRDGDMYSMVRASCVLQ